MSIGSRLREERSRLKLSQSALGEVGGVSKATQIYYENGERLPDAGYLAAIADKGVDVGYVVRGRREADVAGETFNRHLLVEILVAINRWASNRKKPVSDEVKAELTALFYVQFQRKGAVDRDLIEGHLKLVA